MPSEPTDFVDGLITIAGNGDPEAQSGFAIHLLPSTGHGDRYFYNADGEMLIVPEMGRLGFATEFGLIQAEPQEIVVIPRGLRFRVELLDGKAARLYLRELRLPVSPARSRADRRQRTRQPARFPDAGRMVRGP